MFIKVIFLKSIDGFEILPKDPRPNVSEKCLLLDGHQNILVLTRYIGEYGMVYSTKNIYMFGFLQSTTVQEMCN
jgi:hypothetical protein